jgi:hypothetical protein
MTILMRLEVLPNYHKVIQLCDEAMDLFSTRIATRRVAVFLFGLHKMVANMQLGNYQMAAKFAKKFGDKLTKGSVNWLVLKAYAVVCFLHTQNYSKSNRLRLEVLKNADIKSAPDHIVELWSVCNAYVEFVHAVRDDEYRSEFKVNKFLNELPVFSKDKRGLNIAILIIQFLFLLHKRKYSDLIDRADALKQYCYRYLRKDDTFRSHCFIRMLLQIPRADFNRIRTERYAEPYVKKLKSVPLRVSEQSIEVEVIPYDDLWEMTLELLD